MGDSGNFCSIDEQAISNRSVNVEEATYNLQALQKHIFYPKSSTNYPTYSTSYSKSSDYQSSDTGPKSQTIHPQDQNSSTSHLSSSAATCSSSKDNSCLTVAMDSGKQIMMSGGRAIFYERQPSVNDEDLFGDGRRHQDENQAHPNLGNQSNECIVEESTDQVDATVNKETSDNDKKGEEKGTCGVPNFGMLGFSSGSESDPSSSPKPFRTIDESNVQSEQDFDQQRHLEFSDGQDSDFKMRYLEGRSISADDRRKKFRNSSGGEVFDHEIRSVEEEYIVGSHVRKSNSLPDLVVSSNHSPLSPPHYHSNPNPKPDVAENLEKQFEFKKRLEGSSTMPPSKDIHKIKRTVSIKEEPEIIPDNCDESENERSPQTKSEETKERRRIRSSGYVTGSSDAGSQDKSEMGTSAPSRQTSQMSQGSSGVWTSQESEMVENAGTTDEIKDGVVANDSQAKDTQFLSTHSSGSTEKHSVSPVSFGSGGNESNSTESSANTILDARTFEAVRKKIPDSQNDTERQLQGAVDNISSGELPNLSIMGTSNVSGNSSGTFVRLRSKDESYEQNGARSKVSPPVECKPPNSFEPQSHGNLPNFLTLQDSSFSLNKSSLQKVHEEEDKNHLVVKKRYCEGEDGSWGVGQAWPSSISPSSKGSSCSTQKSPPEAVKKWEEMLLKLGHDGLSPSFLDKMLQDMRGPDSLSPHTNHEKEKIEGSGSQNFKDLCLDDLERASRCSFNGCRETCCLKMREVLRVLKLDIPDLDPSYKLVKNYYQSLYQHCDSGCEETKCSVLFCPEFLEWETESSEEPVKHFVKEFQKYFRNPTMKLFLQTSYKFHKIQSRIPKAELKEFETHTPMFPLGKFGAAHVCMDNESQKLVVLKMYPLMECDQQLSLYSRLKDLNHPNIVSQQWMLVYEDKIQVCSLFAQGGSLEEYLGYAGGLPWTRVVLYMKQILSAVIYLNSRGVVYLNWSSGNILFPDDRRHTIQVGNFSLSCPMKCFYDIGTVKECLPYNLCPPELFQGTKADFKSDVWGAGCLFYEMVAGTPFLHELRHEDRKTVHELIQAGSLPDTTSWSKEKRNILYMCWQKKLEDRRSLEDVLRYIQSLRVR